MQLHVCVEPDGSVVRILYSFRRRRFNLNNNKRLKKKKQKKNNNNNNTFIISIFIWSRTDSIFYNTCETSSPLSETRCTRARERTIPASSFLNLNPPEIPFFWCHCEERREKTCTSLPHTHTQQVSRSEQEKRPQPNHTNTFSLSFFCARNGTDASRVDHGSHDRFCLLVVLEIIGYLLLAIRIF